MSVGLKSGTSVPPLVTKGSFPCTVAYPGFVAEHEGLCPKHQQLMHRFWDGTGLCLHCVEEDVRDATGMTYYYGCFQTALERISKVSAWRALSGAAHQAAVSSGTTPEIALLRFVALAARLRGVDRSTIVGEVMAGNIAAVIPNYGAT